MDAGYPKDFSRWRGIPPNINTAMTWTDGETLVWNITFTVFKMFCIDFYLS